MSISVSANAETAVAEPKTEEAAASYSHNFMRFAAGWYLSPSSNIGAGGYEVGIAYHRDISGIALLGPSFYYTGMNGSLVLSDMPRYENSPARTALSINQFRLGVKALVNPVPAWKLPRMKYVWPYLGLDTGLAVHYVTDRGASSIRVNQSSADFYIKPLIGILAFPRSPLTFYVEAGYNMVPTYAFMDKRFNLYGKPDPYGASLNTDGFVLEFGLSYNF